MRERAKIRGTGRDSLWKRHTSGRDGHLKNKVSGKL